MGRRVDAIVVGSTSTLTPLLPMADSETTVAGAVDYKRRPALRSKHGRWRSACFIIVVEMAERIAFYGTSSNLITFLTGKLGQSTAKAAANINAWNGVASLLPILGGVIADSFIGKYYTILASSLLYILGMGLLTLSAVLPSSGCVKNERGLQSAPGCSLHLQKIIFFFALYMVAAAQGGHKPCVQAFGADQFDGEDPEESKAKSSFFNWWYFGLCVGGLLGIAILSYVQDNLSWALGFGIPCIIMVVALVIFLCGTMTYRYVVKGNGQSPFKRIGRVFVAAAKNWPATDRSITEDTEESHETRPLSGSQQFRFLNKALLTTGSSKGDGEVSSIDDVEEAKSVLRLFPIWATNLVFAIVFSQQSTFFTKQGATLNRSIGSSFVVPPASLQSIIAISIVVVIPIYDRAFVPVARAMTGRPAGITTLQRMGIGLFISIICMAVAAVIEKKRLNTALEHGLIDLPNVTIPMSIWWLLPQYILFGIAEAFTMVGLQEFFYDQVPNELRSVGLSLYLSVFGVGSLLSSLLVSIVNKVTSGGGHESWLANNLNRAHLDYFYWLIAGFSVVGFTLFMFFANSYKYKNNGHVNL